jgi:glycosyltransferase involved in cell wall biosynthesis
MYHPAVNYHFCNETLRPSFYNEAWNLTSCEKHSIFVSQCSYPLKGFHLMLEAMAQIVKDYPDAKLYTTGKSPLKLTAKQKLRQNYYHKYLGKLIRRYHLEDHVVFLGFLNEKAMCEAYKKANVFVSPSSLENSSNSVGEAMILGTPVISSDVGGIKNLMEHEKDGYLYQADAPYMLAHYVKKIF